MADYLLQDKHVSFSDEGVHLLRNGYNFKTLKYPSIVETKIKRGNALKNRLVLLVIGLACIGASIYLIIGLIETLNSDESTVFYVEGFLIPLFPLLIGFYSIFVTLKSEIILELKADKTYRFSMKSFEKAGQFEELQALVSSKTRLINTVR